MQSIQYNNLVSRFSKVPVKSLKWLTPLQQFQSLIVGDSQQPQNLADTFYDPNDFYILVKPTQNKKKNSTKQFVLGKKTQSHKQAEQDSIEKPQKVYKAGPFALFYQLNQTKLNKDQEVWYYKEQKDIIGPVSSYNMDKMVYYKNVDDQTRVAYKSVDKFVKFSKIKKIVDASKKHQHEEEDQ